MKTQMMAAVLYGKEDLRVQEVAVPQIAAGDVLVKVRAALTCGTDVKVFRRGYHARMIVPPALFGHELAGDVVSVGDAVTKFRPGDRIVAANSAPCGECHYCRKGNQNLCSDLLFNNGAYAEFMRIPSRIVERNTYLVPHHVTYQDAALIEPLACVMKGVEESGLKPADDVVVIGLGPIGLMFVRLAKVRGARVIAVGRRKTQVDRAARMGADEVIVSAGDTDVVEEVRKLTSGHGADVAIEAVGIPETWEQAVRMVRRGGVVNFFGGCPNDSRVTLETSLLHYSEITCKASFHHTPALIQRALESVSRGEIRASDFVNRVEPLVNLLEVMRYLMSHNGHMKTAIIP
ncbi:MAG TPA: zinc-binding dehydrogenase [Bryobacteraceae bacterium]|nr:zinc-binding dehydrogenase [Bryobacteraceae bacterium]